MIEQALINERAKVDSLKSERQSTIASAEALASAFNQRMELIQRKTTELSVKAEQLNRLKHSLDNVVLSCIRSKNSHFKELELQASAQSDYFSMKEQLHELQGIQGDFDRLQEAYGSLQSQHGIVKS